MSIVRTRHSDSPGVSFSPISTLTLRAFTLLLTCALHTGCNDEASLGRVRGVDAPSQDVARLDSEPGDVGFEADTGPRKGPRWVYVGMRPWPYWAGTCAQCSGRIVECSAEYRGINLYQAPGAVLNPVEHYEPVTQGDKVLLLDDTRAFISGGIDCTGTSYGLHNPVAVWECKD